MWLGLIKELTHEKIYSTLVKMEFCFKLWLEKKVALRLITTL